MDDAVITRMRERIDQLRRVGDMSHDPRIKHIVLSMADQIAEDIIRLEAGEPPLDESVTFDGHPPMPGPRVAE